MSCDETKGTALPRKLKMLVKELKFLTSLTSTGCLVISILLFSFHSVYFCTYIWLSATYMLLLSLWRKIHNLLGEYLLV